MRRRLAARSSDALQAVAPAETQVLTAVHQERDLLRLERDLLRRELEAAHLREQAALEREQAAREREALLLHMLEQAQQQSQRLLDMPRSAPPASPGPGAPVVASAPRGDMRRRIVALLQEHPEGLSPVQTRQLLGLDKSLGSTMKAMARDGLLRRVETGQAGGGDIKGSDTYFSKNVPLYPSIGDI
jgi:hypothetical protein